MAAPAASLPGSGYLNHEPINLHATPVQTHRKQICEHVVGFVAGALAHIAANELRHLRSSRPGSSSDWKLARVGVVGCASKFRFITDHGQVSLKTPRYPMLAQNVLACTSRGASENDSQCIPAKFICHGSVSFYLFSAQNPAESRVSLGQARRDSHRVSLHPREAADRPTEFLWSDHPQRIPQSRSLC